MSTDQKFCRFSVISFLLITLGLHRGQADQPAQAEFSPPLVEDWGDPKRLVFEGATAFTPESLRNGLVQDSDFLLASHPAAPLAGYAEVLRQRVLLGYQRAGFARVQVDTTLDAQTRKLHVQIREGKRYTNGAIQIRGAKTLAVEELNRRLTEPYPPPDRTLPDLPWNQPQNVTPGPGGVRVSFDAGLKTSEQLAQVAGQTRINRLTGKKTLSRPAVWVPGEPTPFDTLSLKAITQGITNVLAELGYFFSDVRADLAPDETRNAAQLNVQILDEGSRATLETIEISGNNKNTRAALLKYLQLRPGMPLSREAIDEVELHLREAARFSSFRVATAPLDQEKSKITMTIHLTEYEPAPPLEQDFSEFEKGLLKCGDWLSHAAGLEDDLMLAGSSAEFIPLLGKFQFILSRQGLILLFGQKGHSTEGPLTYGSAWTASNVLFYSNIRKMKCVVPRSGGRLIGQFGISSLPPDSDPANRDLMNFEFGAGFSSVSDERTGASQPPAPLELDVRAEPVAMIKALHRRNVQARVEGGLLQLSHEDHRIAIDPKTGRLVHWQWLDTNGAVATSWVAQKGLFEQALGQMEQELAAFTNTFQHEAPVSSVLRFFLSELASILGPGSKDLSNEQRLCAASAIQRLLRDDVFGPLESLLLARFRSTNESFSIPTEALTGSQNAMVSAMLAWAFQLANEFLPPRSWPWTVARESVFVANRKAKFTDFELQRLYDSPRVGPLGFLTVAKLLAYVQSPTARPFAIRGLTRLSAEEFQTDWRLLFEGNSRLAQSVTRLGAALADLRPEEVEALAALLPKDTGRLLAESSRVLRENRNKPIQDRLAPVLDSYWNSSLKDVVARQLRELLRPPQPGQVQP